MSEPTLLWTIQLSNWRLAKQQDVFLLNTTAKSGLQPFAPEYSNVMAYKRGELTEQEYTVRYWEKMQLSQQQYPKHWARLKHYPRVAVACYCRAGAFCHRHLFVELAKTYLEQAGHTVILKGELIHQQD